MEKVQPRYIGRMISLKSIRDFILDEQLMDEHVIVLNRKNFDDIVIDFRTSYGSSIELPYKFLGVLIEEDFENQIPIDRVGVKRIANASSDSDERESVRMLARKLRDF